MDKINANEIDILLNNPQFMTDVLAGREVGSARDLEALAAELRANHTAAKMARWGLLDGGSDISLRYRKAKEERAHARQTESVCSGCGGRVLDGRCASDCSRAY